MKYSNYQTHSLKKKKCFLCDSSHTSALFKRNKHVMVKCRNCGLIYQFPQVDKGKYLKEIQKHYSELDPFYRVAYSRESLYKRFLHKIRPTKRKNARLLDVGCGLGYFLYLAKNDGWNVFGSELNPDLVKIGTKNYGLDIQCADFEESTFPDGYFDVITLWNVLDELLNPAGNILKIKKILKPGGILYTRTPNAVFHLFAYRIQQILRKLHLEHIIPYHTSIFHIFNFSKKTLKWILRDNGFSNIKIKNSWPTTEDPYGVKKGVIGFKMFSFFIAQCIFFISLGKLTFASSIEVFAENAKS